MSLAMTTPANITARPKFFVFGMVLLSTLNPQLPTCFAQSPVSSGNVITIAGNGSAGFSGDGGPATNATFNSPYGLAIGPDGTLYVADSSNYRIRAIAPSTGLITTVAGNGSFGDTGDDGPATNATISGVNRIAVDRFRHALYLGDTDNNRVRKLNLTNGVISNFAGLGFPVGVGFAGDGGPATLAEFDFPDAVCTDGIGRLSITDLFNNRIRQVNPVTGIITTIAGNGNGVTAGDGGLATGASLSPRRLTADSAGNVFVQDTWTNSIRRIAASTGIITTIAGGGTNTPGSGPATNMNIGDFSDLVVSDAGKLFIADTTRVFLVDLATGQFSLFAGGTNGAFSGDGGPALDARFDYISSLALTPGGGLLICSWGHARVRYVAPDSINLTNDQQQTAFYLPWVSALAGDLTIANNPNLTNVILAALTDVAGDVEITGNDSATLVDLNSISGVSGSVVISDNPSAQAIALGSVETVGEAVIINDNAAAGSVDLSGLLTAASVEISGNTSATNIDLGSVSGTTGSVVISNNPVAQTISIGALETVGEAVVIKDNAAAFSVDLNGLLAAAIVEIRGNSGATNVNLSSLSGVTGPVVISDNASAQTIALGSISSVLGNITIESNAPGTTVDLSNLTSYGCGTNEVTMTLEEGTVALTNGLTLCANATLTGSSTVYGSLTNNGTIEPGSSPGTLNIAGSLVLLPGSRLRFELAGTIAGSQYDQLNISNAVMCAGSLNVQLTSAFTPSAGQVFQLINATNRLGAFASVNLPALPAGLAWTNRLPIDGSVGVVAAVEPAPILNPQMLPSGSFQFGFTNLSGLVFNILTTTNLALPVDSWTVLGPATELTPGQYRFTDSAATNQTQRFYRLRWP
jgi:sugar lactone lactonase YvrE